MSIKQISVFLENRAGALSEVTSLIAENGIDLRAINLAETTDYGILRFIADNSKKAVEVLCSNGFIARANDVIVIAVADKSGGLHTLLDLLADENLDIQYMYSIFSGKGDNAYMVIQVKDVLLAEQIFKKHNIKTADKAELNIK